MSVEKGTLINIDDDQMTMNKSLKKYINGAIACDMRVLDMDIPSSEYNTINEPRVL